MRVEKEYRLPSVKATLFAWNNKYLLKFEQGGLEQTYKFSELDYTIAEIEDIMNEKFIKTVEEIFLQMNKNLFSTRS